MVEGVAYLMLPAVAIFFGLGIVLDRVIEMFLDLLDFIRGAR